MFHTEDADWKQMIETYKAQVTAIRLPQDIDPAKGKHILSKLDDVYAGIRFEYSSVLKLYEEVESLIDRIRRKAEGMGTNSETRRANGVMAVENAPKGDGTTINLYNLYTALNFKKRDLESLIAAIEQKQSMIITMNGLLKIESNISGY